MTVADFALQLKTETKKSHTAAENTKFVSSFLKGVVTEDNYRKLVSDLYFVYRAMEEEIDKLKDHPCIKPIAFSELARTAQLEKDLNYYYGKDWRDLVVPSESCQRYVNRIREVADEDPELLVGHHYTRYLGDLSGGQILRGIADKALDLPEGEGLHFYEFPEIEDNKEFKTNYRASLDSLPISQSGANAIINEANYAFRLNMYMFDEIQGNGFKAFVKLLCSVVKGRTMT